MAIHSLTSYKTLAGARYAVYFDGMLPRRVLTQDFTEGGTTTVAGTLQVPYVLGAQVASASKWSWALAKDFLHGFNGVDKKMLDKYGVLRDIGLPLMSGTGSVTASQGSSNASGIAAANASLANPGYQFYGCLYNRATGDVGNRIKFGSRVNLSEAANVNLENLPSFASTNTEWDILLGRTDDGAEVPHVIIDSAGQFVYVRCGLTSYVVTDGSVDKRYELPTRSDQPPAFDKICRVGDRFYAAEPNSAYVRYTESEEEVAKEGGYGYLGIAFHSWPADNFKTFPTGDDLTCLAESNQAAWCFSKNDMAILVDQSGELNWQGPWSGHGAAGQDAFTNSAHGPHWVTGNKQLATMSEIGPVVVSGEYESALISKISDTYLSDTMVKPVVIPEKQIDILFIKGRDASGDPVCIIHDFNLGGQGYEASYLEALAEDFCVGVVDDSDGRRKLWAGGSDGYLYELFDGTTDNGEEYTADTILLFNAGPDKPLNPFIEWIGDKNVLWDIGQSLDSVLANYTPLSSSAGSVPGAGTEPHYRVPLLSPECKYVYVRMRLTSHSADGNLNLNSPPHVPLETYGRVYMISPMKKPGSERGV